MSTRRRQIAKAFKAARPHLRPVAYNNAVARGLPTANTFICHSLDDAQGCGYITHHQMQMAVAVIESRLGPNHDTVEDFLATTIGGPTLRAAYRQDPDCIQQYRVRWLDSLIEEFSK